jgi:hypothetical protein
VGHWLISTTAVYNKNKYDYINENSGFCSTLCDFCFSLSFSVLSAYKFCVFWYACHTYVICSTKVCCDMVWHIHVSTHHAMHEGNVQSFALLSCLFLILHIHQNSMIQGTFVKFLCHDPEWHQYHGLNIVGIWLWVDILNMSYGPGWLSLNVILCHIGLTPLAHDMLFPFGPDQ